MSGGALQEEGGEAVAVQACADHVLRSGDAVVDDELELADRVGEVGLVVPGLVPVLGGDPGAVAVGDLALHLVQDAAAVGLAALAHADDEAAGGRHGLEQAGCDSLASGAEAGDAGRGGDAAELL